MAEPLGVTTAADDAGVSIVIPCFNEKPAHLSECLESVLEQTFADWEAIVVDDASTEIDVQELVSEMSDHRIRVSRHARNRGLGAARNTGFRNTRAPLVLPLDSDDRLHREFLAMTTSYLHAHQDADCVFTDIQQFGSSSERVSGWRSSARDTLHEMLIGQWIPGAGTLMRREVWEGTGGYSEDLRILGNEDWDFWIAALANGSRPAHIPEALYLYRRHPASVSSFSIPNHEAAHREIIYERRRAIFDSYGAGGRFRAMGYLNNAAFAWRAGDRSRAVSLGWRGLRIRGGTGPLLVAATRRLARWAVARMSKRLRTAASKTA